MKDLDDSNISDEQAGGAIDCSGQIHAEFGIDPVLLIQGAPD